MSFSHIFTSKIKRDSNTQNKFHEARMSQLLFGCFHSQQLAHDSYKIEIVDRNVFSRVVLNSVTFFVSN